MYPKSSEKLLRGFHVGIPSSGSRYKRSPSSSEESSMLEGQGRKGETIRRSIQSKFSWLSPRSGHGEIFCLEFSLKSSSDANLERVMLRETSQT